MPRCIRLSVETLFCSPTWSSSSPRHVVVLFQESPPHGFLKEAENPSGFHRSLPVVRISPPLSRIHVGGFAFFGFFRGKWWSWFGGRAQKQAPGAWLIQCGDYDRDLYREDPLESEGVADNLHETPPENFANLEGVVRKMYNQETEDSSALFSSNIQGKEEWTLCWTNHTHAVDLFGDFKKYMMIPDEWKAAEIRSNKPGYAV